MTTIPLPVQADVVRLERNGSATRLSGYWTHDDAHEAGRARAARPVAAQGRAAAPARGERASLFVFDESDPPPRG